MVDPLTKFHRDVTRVENTQKVQFSKTGNDISYERILEAIEKEDKDQMNPHKRLLEIYRRRVEKDELKKKEENGLKNLEKKLEEMRKEMDRKEQEGRRAIQKQLEYSRLRTQKTFMNDPLFNQRPNSPGSNLFGGVEPSATTPPLDPISGMLSIMNPLDIFATKKNKEKILKKYGNIFGNKDPNDQEEAMASKGDAFFQKTMVSIPQGSLSKMPTPGPLVRQSIFNLPNIKIAEPQTNGVSGSPGKSEAQKASRRVSFLLNPSIASNRQISEVSLPQANSEALPPLIVFQANGRIQYGDLESYNVQLAAAQARKAEKRKLRKLERSQRNQLRKNKVIELADDLIKKANEIYYGNAGRPEVDKKGIGIPIGRGDSESSYKSEPNVSHHSNLN